MHRLTETEGEIKSTRCGRTVTYLRQISHRQADDLLEAYTKLTGDTMEEDEGNLTSGLA